MPLTDYEINWRNFQPWASDAIKNLFEDQNFSDVTLVSDELKELRAHKVILSASSPFFSSILKTKTNPQPLLFLKGIKFDVLSLILKFIYEGEVNVPHDLVQNFMMIAHEIKIKGLNLEAFENNKDLEYPSKEADPLENDNSKDEEVNYIQEEVVSNEVSVNASETLLESSSSNMKYELEALVDDTTTDDNYELEALDEATDIEMDLSSENAVISEQLIGSSKDQEITIKNEQAYLIKYPKFESSDENRFACTDTICGKSFKSLIHLDNHRKRVHLGEKKEQCPQCPKKFYSAGEVESHKTYVHSTEKNFSCTMCDKKFVRMDDANKHMKAVHLKVRDFTCRFCTRKFSQVSNMNTHMRRNHFEDWARWKTSQMKTVPIDS